MKKEKQYERNKKKKTSTSWKNKRTDGWRRKIKIENVKERGKEERMNVQTMKKEVIMLPTIVNNFKTLLEINRENI